MPQFIEADVIQKIATAAEWGTLLGTKIPYKGQIMLVSDGTGKVVNIKVGDGVNNFAALTYMFDTIQANVNYVQVTGTALPTPTITSGFSVVGEGTYTRAGQPDVVVPSGELGILFWDGTVWSLQDSVSLPAAPPVTKDTIQPFAFTKDEYVPEILIDTAVAPTITVNGVTITDPLQKADRLKRLDQALKSFKVFGLPEGKFLAIRQFSFNPSGNYGIGITVLDNEKDDFNISTLPVAFISGTADYSKPFTIELAERYRTYSYIITMDMSAFQGENISFNFRDSVGMSNYKKCGLKTSGINLLPYKSFWNLKFGLNSSASHSYPESYYFHQAIKMVRVSAQEDCLIRIDTINYNSGTSNIQFIIYACSDDDPENINVVNTRNRYTIIRINLNRNLTGLQRLKSFVLSGPIQAEVEMVVDMDYLIPKLPLISTAGVVITSSNTIAHWVVKKVSSGGGGETVTLLSMIEGGDDFQGNFRFVPSTGNWALLASNNMTKLSRIPTGTTSIDFLMQLDGGNSNAMYLDKNMKFLEWAYNGASGTVENLNSVPPVLARFVLASTTTATASAKIVANGTFTVNKDVKSYRSINEGLSDKHSGLYFMVNGNMYQKNIDSVCTVGEYKSVGGGWLESVPEFEKDGGYIIPTGVLHTNGTNTYTGGTLCAVKNGVMYFYNAKDCAIFKSEDNGATFSTIVDKFSHPGVWDTQDVNTESRSAIVVMDNGELLFPVRMRGDVFSTDPVERRERYWCLYRTKNGQTDIEKCFNFSHEDTIKDWLPTTDPQYKWPNYSGGCMLGNFTHATYGSMIVITEYGMGTSKYWLTQTPPVNNNARGISARAWVSFDYGVTWKKMFDGDRKKSGTAESDNNWFYFTSTNAAKMRHMHGVDIDIVREVVNLTNGDAEDYIWTISIDDLLTWYNSAPATSPTEKPEYKTTDTFPNWTSHAIVPETGNSNSAYSSMRAQLMKSVAVEKGAIWGHDAAREFAYLSYTNNGEFILEPVFQFEKRSDFATDQDFVNSWTSTDGFIQDVTQHDGVIYFAHSNGGTRPARIWASRNGIDWKVAYEGDNTDIKFAGKILFDNDKVYLSDGTFGQASNLSGFWKLKRK